MSFETVVKISRVVSDFVGQIDELSLKGRTLVKKVFAKLGMVALTVIARVFDYAFPHFEGKVQPGKRSVTLLEIFNDAERVKIVIKEQPVTPHGRIQRFLPGVSERRMADIVNEREGLCEIDIEIERSGNRARDLRDFKRVGQSVAKMIGVAPGEDLSFGFQTPKGARVDNPITVSLKIVAVEMRWLGVAASARLLDMHRVTGEHEESLAER